MEEKSAAKRYVMNLHDDISHKVRPLKPRTLNQALQEALETEVWCKERLRVKVYDPPTITKYRKTAHEEHTCDCDANSTVTNTVPTL